MMTESLTYREMADRMGIKLDSARKMALRKRWQKTTGNDGTVRVMVPVEVLERQQDNDNDITSDVTGPTSLELQVRIEGLKALVESEKQRADAAEADRDAWRAEAQRSLWSRMFG